jgi:uncharacterized protein YkwD
MVPTRFFFLFLLGGIAMKTRLKKLLSIALATVFVLSSVACGKSAGEIGEDAAARVYDPNETRIFIDDEAAALAGSFAEEDATLIQMARDAFDQTNAQRVAAGLPALAWSDALSETAYVRAQEIVTLFSHTRPNGSDWYTVNSSIMYGENLAKNFGSASAVVTGWMNSPTHRENIMDGSFRTLGIAIFRGDDGKLYFAQEFGY